jgi:hypothetical protein
LQETLKVHVVEASKFYFTMIGTFWIAMQSKFKDQSLQNCRVPSELHHFFGMNEYYVTSRESHHCSHDEKDLTRTFNIQRMEVSELETENPAKLEDRSLSIDKIDH